MSDRRAGSRHGKDEVAGKSLQTCQSIWMAHWMSSSSRAGNEGHGPEKNTDKSECVKRFAQVTETKAIDFMNERSLASSSRKFGNPTLEGKALPMFGCSENTGSAVDMRSCESSGQQKHAQWLQVVPNSGCCVSAGRTENRLLSMQESGPSERGTQSREFQFLPSAQQVKSCNLAEKNSFIIPTAFGDNLLGSTSKLVPYGVNVTRTPMQSFFCGPEDIQVQPRALLVHDDKTNKRLAPLNHDTSPSNNELKDFAGDQFQKIPTSSDVELLHSQINPLEVSRLKKMGNESYALAKTSSSIHDVETMRIYTSLDSIQDSSRGPPKFSETTHHFFISKKTGINLSEGGQMFRESTISTKFEGKQVGELLSLSPGLGFHVKPGVKLQPLDSSTESDEKDHHGKFTTFAANPKNESSCETDIMDIDGLWDDHHFGVATSPPNKDIQQGQESPKCQAAVPSVREEIAGRLLSTELPDEKQEPDVNQELAGVPGVVSLADDRETSTSKTESLDVECFLSQAEGPSNSKSSAFPNDLQKLEPFSRWVKRLKPSSSDSFGYGTKSSKMPEASSHEKVNKFFSRMLKCSNTSSENIEVGQTRELMRNGGSLPTESVRKSQDMSLPLAWIQRWCHNHSASLRKKPESVVVCEPHSSKATLDDLKKKQFPSIAAMALMGKAMAGFRPCEFRKRGSSVVWNTKGVD